MEIFRGKKEKQMRKNGKEKKVRAKTKLREKI
jgi:hypothetical protein